MTTALVPRHRVQSREVVLKRFLWCVGLVAAIHGCGGGGDPVDSGALDGADDCATGLVRCGDRWH